jgi:hypothetical protein
LLISALLGKVSRKGQMISQVQDKTRKNFIDYKEKFADLIVKLQKSYNQSQALIEASLFQANNNINYNSVLTCYNPSYDRMVESGSEICIAKQYHGLTSKTG